MSKKKILVIDDDAQLVDSVRILLESTGYEVFCAYQAEKGRALARETRPDLIVMDILFAGPPGPSGVEVARQLAQDPELKDTPVLILSGVKKVLDMPVKLGPDEAYMPVQAFLEKPFKPGELLSEIEELLALCDSVEEEGMGRILVVDEEEHVLDFVKEALRGFGYEVTSYSQSEAAVGYYQIHWREIDLVILDMGMPALNGYETHVAMRTTNPCMKAILSTGYSGRSESQRLLSAGGVGLLEKPFSVRQLALAVHLALANHTVHMPYGPVSESWRILA